MAENQGMKEFSDNLGKEAGGYALDEYRKQVGEVSEENRKAMDFAANYVANCSVPMVMMKFLRPMQGLFRWQSVLIFGTLFILLAYAVCARMWYLPTDFQKALFFLIPSWLGLIGCYVMVHKTSKNVNQQLRDARRVKKNLDREMAKQQEQGEVSEASSGEDAGGGAEKQQEGDTGTGKKAPQIWKAED